MEWSNQLTMEFLKLYEKEPCIWNPKDPFHRDRNVVLEAWKRIANNLSVKYPVFELKKKKESLMATYRNIYRKIRASMESGNKDEVLKTHWFAFGLMSRFLDGIYQPKSNTEVADDSETTLDSHDTEESVDYSKIFLPNNVEFTIKTEDETCIAPTLSPSQSSKKRKADVIETALIEPYTYATNVVPDAHFAQEASLKDTSSSNDKDICSLYVELLAKKLRGFDEHTRDILMNDIDNLVFRMKMQLRKQGGEFASSARQPVYTQQNSNIYTPSSSQSPSTSNISKLSPPRSQPSPVSSYLIRPEDISSMVESQQEESSVQPE